MLPESPYVTPFIATSGILGTLTLDHINTSVAILVGVLTMCYLAIKIYKEIFKCMYNVHFQVLFGLAKDTL